MIEPPIRFTFCPDPSKGDCWAWCLPGHCAKPGNRPTTITQPTTPDPDAPREAPIDLNEIARQAAQRALKQ